MESSGYVPGRAVSVVLTVHGSYLLQLRDNIPGIVSPGQWSLWSGSIERNESYRAAAVREVLEETGFVIRPKELLRHEEHVVFYADVSRNWSRIKLGEGAAFAIFPLEKARQAKLVCDWVLHCLLNHNIRIQKR